VPAIQVKVLDHNQSSIRVKKENQSKDNSEDVKDSPYICDRLVINSIDNFNLIDEKDDGLNPQYQSPKDLNCHQQLQIKHNSKNSHEDRLNENVVENHGENNLSGNSGEENQNIQNLEYREPSHVHRDVNHDEKSHDMEFLLEKEAKVKAEELDSKAGLCDDNVSESSNRYTGTHEGDLSKTERGMLPLKQKLNHVEKGVNMFDKKEAESENCEPQRNGETNLTSSDEEIDDNEKNLGIQKASPITKSKNQNNVLQTDVKIGLSENDTNHIYPYSDLHSSDDEKDEKSLRKDSFSERGSMGKSLTENDENSFDEASTDNDQNSIAKLYEKDEANSFEKQEISDLKSQSQQLQVEQDTKGCAIENYFFLLIITAYT
jgi:hypothetical protein